MIKQHKSPKKYFIILAFALATPSILLGVLQTAKQPADTLESSERESAVERSSNSSMPGLLTNQHFPFQGQPKIIHTASGKDKTDDSEESDENKEEKGTDEEELDPESEAFKREITPALVTIEGDQGVGSGFVCKIKNRLFVVTNLHVLAGNTTFTINNMNGDTIQQKGFFEAKGHDIALLRIEGEYPFLEVEMNNSKNTKIGDKVIVSGNESGGGVSTFIHGKVLGLGPKKVEVDAKFVPGNSGSPIVNLSTKKVIGVATYIVHYDMSKSKKKENLRKASERKEVRWFGYRIDSVKKWNPVNINRFNAQYQKLDEIKSRTKDVMTFMFSDSRNINDAHVKKIVDEYYQLISNNGRKTRRNAREVYDNAESFTVRLQNLMEIDIDEFIEKRPYDFFLSEAKREQQLRKQIGTYVDEWQSRVQNAKKGY